METKLETFDKFDELPDTAKAVVANHLSLYGVFNLALTSKEHYKLYDKDNPFFTPIYSSKFLHHTVRREDEKVLTALKKDINLIIKKGAVTDCSGRTFKNISAFEYTVWARDKHLWTKMLAYIPTDANGLKTVNELINQLKNIQEYGLTYELKIIERDGAPEQSVTQIITEKHFDFENTIIKALEVYIDILNTPPINWADADKQWINGVGLAQKAFPMHVVYEYCSQRAFNPLPDFSTAPEAIRQVHNLASSQYKDWFAVDNEAIYKGALRAQEGRNMAAGYCRCDLTALKALCEIRTKDCDELMATLDTLRDEITQNLPNQSHLSY